MQNSDIPAQLQQRLPSLADMTPIVPLQRQFLAASLAMLAPECDLPPHSVPPNLTVQPVFALLLAPVSACICLCHNRPIWLGANSERPQVCQRG